MSDDRIERLLTKAEQAIDRNETEQADAYQSLIEQAAELRRREAREIRRMVNADTEAH